ncbi:MAG: diguanylate cyclase [Dehalococcoidia bacterium]
MNAENDLHPLLELQLRRLGLRHQCAPVTTDLWRSFLEHVQRSYREADQDRYTLERALTISSGEMKQLYERLATEKRILEMIANGAPLAGILDALCRAVQEEAPDALGAVALLEGDQLRFGAAPNLPPAYKDAIDGLPIGPNASPCAAAAYLKQPVVVADLSTDPLGETMAALTDRFGPLGCCATPIFSAAGDVLGAFAVYWPGPRAATDHDMRRVERSTHLAGIAIEHQRAQEALREREATLRATIDSTEDGILVVTNTGRVSYANSRLAEMWRVPEALLAERDGAEILKHTLDQLHDPHGFTTTVRELYQSTDTATDTIFFKDGRVFELLSRPLVAGEGLPGRVWSFRDITERRQAELELRSHAAELQRLNEHLTDAHSEIADSQTQLREYAQRLERAVEVEHQQAVTDPLTGLANHRGAHIHLAQAIEEARGRKRPLSLVLTDIDGFKLFNDTYGHAAGDDILRLVGGILRESCETRDLASRYGGDEFLLVLPGRGHRAALTVARRIATFLGASEFRTESGDRIPVSVAVGVASLPRDATTLEKLIAAADAAMYHAKRERVNRRPGASQITDARRGDTAFGVLDSLVQAIDVKDRYTKDHSDVVAEYGMKLAARLGLSQQAQRALRIAGLLHDVGKLAVPDEVLKKPAALDPDEYEAIKRHVVIGEVLIREVPQLKDVLQAVSCHHERYDGKGYPRGLKGKQIPVLGRIIAIADAYSAMVLDRPYRKALTLEHVLRELEEGAGTQFDPDIARVFRELLVDEAEPLQAAA